MKIKKVWSVYFSATTTTEKVVRKIADVAAEKLGADYLIAGHIFNTPCKQGTPGRGLDYLRRVCESVSIPVFGIGGITE